MKEIVEGFLSRGYLLNPELAEKLKKIDYKKFLEKISQEKSRPLILNYDILTALENKKDLININWIEFEKAYALYENGKEKEIYKLFLSILNQRFEKNNLQKSDNAENLEISEINDIKDNLIILKNYNDIEKERKVETFTNYFKQRYFALKNILINRQELQNSISINKLQNKSEHEKIALIGLVNDKRTTKNGNLIINLEDPTGLINIVVSKNKPQLFNEANDILLDEVIGITGTSGDRIVFVNNIYFPDIPGSNPIKKFNEEVYALFTSDIQVGNKLFFEKSFLKFIDWLNLKYGDEKQKEIAKKVKYLFMPGDLVEGVGVYPGQEEDLMIQDIYQQYDKLAEYLNKIRKDIKIILTPGNHDAVQIAEPQPIINEKWAYNLHQSPNIYHTTNPSLVNISSTKDFPGFNVLIYHGFSFPYIAENVDTIRKAGRIERPDLIMKFQLQKRHLAPSHSSTLYLPNSKEDPLIIDKVPDFFISGHLHKTMASNYKGITIANCSTWVGQTEDQQRRGIIPDPCKAILANLKTREVKILNFKENE